MRNRLSIRTRFALLSAALAVGVLGAGMFTVYQIERRQVEQNLRADARNAAVNCPPPGSATALPTTAHHRARPNPATTAESRDQAARRR